MKRNIFLFISIFTTLLFSCSEIAIESDPTNTPETGTIIDVVISSEAQSATKVSYTSNTDGSEFAFSWHSGDEISVVVPDAIGNSNNKFSAYAATNTSNFGGQLASWAGAYDLYAIFPYKSAGYSVSSGTIYHSLEEQSVDASSSNSFENGLMVAVAGDATAVSSDNYYIPTLSFQQVMSFYQLSLKDIPTDETIVKIGFEASSDLFIESATVDLTDATIADQTMTSKVNATVSGFSGTTATLNFALFPVDLSTQAVTLVVTTLCNDGYNTYSKEFNPAANFERNTFIHHGEELSLNDFDGTESAGFMLADFSATNYPQDSDVWQVIDQTATLDEFYCLRDALYSAYDEGREITLIAENLTEIPTITAYGSDSWYAGAFNNCYALVAVEMPAVTSIGSMAFKGCSALETISFPEVETIEYNAFYSCDALKSVSLPKLTTLDSHVFSDCQNLESVSLPAATTIGDSSFYNCNNLTSIHLPEVKTVGTDYGDEYPGGAMEQGAFYACTSLKTISLPKATLLSTGTFAGCFLLEDVDLPEVTTIYSQAFVGCESLKNISLPSATTISSWSFYGCSNLESAYLPSITTFDGGNPFINCESLTTLEVNSEYFTLEDCVLYDTNKEKIVFALGSISGDYVAPESVETICEYAFAYCNYLNSAIFPNVITVECDAFYNCDGLISASFPMATTVEYYAFYNCDNLESVYLPAATNISTIVFSYCTSLTQLEIATNGAIIETFGGRSSMFSSVTLSNLTLTLGAANASMVDGLYFNAPYNGSTYTYGPFKEINFTGAVSSLVVANGENAGGTILNW